MSYTLITPNGTEHRFFIRVVAELYQSINGGRIVGDLQLKLVDTVTA